MSVLAHISSLDLVVTIGQCGGSIGRRYIRLFNLFVLILMIASYILRNVIEHIVLRNAQDQEEPEQVHGLQTGKQRKGNDLTNPTFILLGLPIQFIGADGAKLCEDGPENFQVDDMAHVDPNGHKERNVWSDEHRVQVIEQFGCLDWHQKRVSEHSIDE